MMDVELVQEATTPEQMRAEIYRLSRNEHLVRMVMDTANFNGLSAEDRYTMLAYYALRDRQRFLQQCLEFSCLMPPDPIIVKKS